MTSRPNSRIRIRKTEEREPKPRLTKGREVRVLVKEEAAHHLPNLVVSPLETPVLHLLDSFDLLLEATVPNQRSTLRKKPSSNALMGVRSQALMLKSPRKGLWRNTATTASKATEPSEALGKFNKPDQPPKGSLRVIQSRAVITNNMTTRIQWTINICLGANTRPWSAIECIIFIWWRYREIQSNA